MRRYLLPVLLACGLVPIFAVGAPRAKAPGLPAPGAGTAKTPLVVTPASGATFSNDTELPAAAALSDSDPATPTTPTVGAASMILDAAVPAFVRVRTAKNFTDDGAGGANPASGMLMRNSAATGWVGLNADAQKQLKVVSGGYTDVITATLTRPANTTAYASGDEVTDTGGAIQTLTSMARYSGGTGTIEGVSISVSSNWATKPTLDLMIYDTTSTPQTDNAAFAPSDGVQDTLLAVIPISTTAIGDATASTGNFQMDTGSIAVPFKTSGSANLFLRVVERNAGQAGANSDTLKFRFRVLQD